jgi:hypothetical protein
MRTPRQWYRKRQLILCDYCGHAKYKHPSYNPHGKCGYYNFSNKIFKRADLWGYCTCRAFLMPKKNERKYLGE